MEKIEDKDRVVKYVRERKKKKKNLPYFKLEFDIRTK